MLIETKNNRQVLLRSLDSNDLDNLIVYLNTLSAETKKRFGPHEFDKQSVIDFTISGNGHSCKKIWTLANHGRTANINKGQVTKNCHRHRIGDSGADSCKLNISNSIGHLFKCWADVFQMHNHRQYVNDDAIKDKNELNKHGDVI